MLLVCNIFKFLSERWVYQLIVVIALLVLAFARPNGLNFGRYRTPTSEERAKLNRILEEAQAHERRLLDNIVTRLGGLPQGDRLKYVGDRLSKAIDYAIRRHDWYEDQRARIFQGTVAVSSAIFVVAGWIAKDTSTAGETTTLFAFLATALIGLLFGIFYYNEELDADRPYRLVSDIRIWYFKYNLPGNSNFSGADPVAMGQAVLTDRRRFFERAVVSLEPPDSIREDLEQIFILQILQRYKSESLKKMRWLLSYFVTSFALQISIWCAASYL